MPQPPDKPMRPLREGLHTMSDIDAWLRMLAYLKEEIVNASPTAARHVGLAYDELNDLVRRPIPSSGHPVH